MQLKIATPTAWLDCVLTNINPFLIDHAHAEKKASGMAMSMIAHYPDRTQLVKAMADLAVEELIHFKQMMKILHARELILTPDEKDPYVNQLRRCFRQGTEAYLLDRLLIAGIIEARGCERFGLVAAALPPGDLKVFYQMITKSEAKHHTLFTDLAEYYFEQHTVTSRLSELLELEADIVAQLPLRPCLH
ncbi:MAG: tRNA-(ms[2]io[6]A)-hydroxylase [Shewanellaceae bacterium]|nr:tRNA-(ms[2]io[6]A)-hydroxylase [Shewanellaceae bacterium]